jgi:hypothetical protein
MEISVQIPQGKLIERIEIDGKPLEAYQYHDSKHQLKLTLPPFKYNHIQKDLIKFKAHI